MRATYMYGAGDVRVIDTPDPTIQQPTDALVRVARTCVCGSDLHPYFAWSCGRCEFCRAGLQTSCVNSGFWAAGEPAHAFGRVRHRLARSGSWWREGRQHRHRDR